MHTGDVQLWVTLHAALGEMEKSVVIQLLVLVVCHFCHSVEDKCPQPCDCQHPQHILCSNRGLRSVPSSSHILNPTGTKTYSLGGNFIVNISAIDFSNYFNLQRLDLQYNQIHFIHPKGFDKLSQLEELYLGNNQLPTLTASALSPLRKLKVLNVNSNRLQNVSRASFSSLASLVKLRLDSNNIRTLHGSPFQSLANLLYLHLENNKITNISKNSFAGLVKLRLLSLSGNPLNSLLHPLFLPLRSLSTLTMAGCNLQQLGPGVFHGLQRLSKLILSSNRISLLHNKTFQGLGSLQELHLDGNLLSHLPEGLLVPLHSLEILNLSRNSLSNMHPKTFSGLSRLRVLDLQHNMLPFLPGDILSENPALYRLQLDGNPWNCNCYLLGLKQWIVGTLHTRIRMLTVFVQCREPRDVAGKYLDYLEDSYLQETGDCMLSTTPKATTSSLIDVDQVLHPPTEGQKSEPSADQGSQSLPLHSKASSLLPISMHPPETLTSPLTLALEQVSTTRVPLGTKRASNNKHKKTLQQGRSRNSKTSGATRNRTESKLNFLKPSLQYPATENQLPVTFQPASEKLKQLPFKESKALISSSNNLHNSLPNAEVSHQQPPELLQLPDVTGTLQSPSEIPLTGDSHLKLKTLQKDTPAAETLHQSHSDVRRPSLHFTHPEQSDPSHKVVPFPSTLSDPCEFNKLYLLNLSVESVGSTTARVRWQAMEPHTHGPVLFRVLYERFGQGGRFQRFVYPRGPAESLTLHELTGDTPYLVCVESLIGGRACPVAPREHCVGLVTLSSDDDRPLLNYQMLALILLALNALLLLLGLVVWGSRVARKKWCRKRAPVHVRQMYSTRRPYRSVGTGVSTDFSGFQSHRPRTAVCALGEADLIEFPACDRFRDVGNVHREDLLQRFTD